MNSNGGWAMIGKTDPKMLQHPGDHMPGLAFTFKNSGILYENMAIQIAVNSEFRENVGSFNLFYENKAGTALQRLQTTLVWPEEKAAKLLIKMNPIVEPLLGVGKRIVQMCKVECFDDFAGFPELLVSFLYHGRSINITIKLPLTLNKFFEPMKIDGELFSAGWRKLSKNLQLRSQRIFGAHGEMDLVAARAKLVGFGMQILEGVNAKPGTIVAAGIVHMRNEQVQCLLSLEPYIKWNKFRLTVVSMKGSVSVEVCDLLQDQF